MADPAPVIAIDGPSASGKGSVAAEVARELGFHYLDSGALYRLVGLAALRGGVALDDASRLAGITAGLDARFPAGRVLLAGDDVTDAIREETVSDAASRVAAIPGVRAALLDRQRAFRQPPGLVADGRDMASAVFPDACLKVYLTASAEERARRRHKQLIAKGMDANISTLLRDIRDRDARDTRRAAAPLKQVEGASLLDTTAMTIVEAVTEVIRLYRLRVAR